MTGKSVGIVHEWSADSTPGLVSSVPVPDCRLGLDPGHAGEWGCGHWLL